MGLCYEEPSGICRGRKAAGGPPCILGRNVQAVAQVCDEARGAADHAFICHLVCKVLVDPTEQALAAVAAAQHDDAWAHTAELLAADDEAVRVGEVGRYWIQYPTLGSPTPA